MSSRTTPATFLIHDIQAPARGSAASAPENTPTTTSSADMPSENTNRYRNPSTALRVVATQVRTAANAGAPQGAATSPDVAPSRNTAGEEPPPRRPPPAESRTGGRAGVTASNRGAETRRRVPLLSHGEIITLSVQPGAIGAEDYRVSCERQTQRTSDDNLSSNHHRNGLGRSCGRAARRCGAAVHAASPHRSGVRTGHPRYDGVVPGACRPRGRRYVRHRAAHRARLPRAEDAGGDDRRELADA